ncbi:MAG: hypothetical protein A2X52_01660 [Candidatus Rokubacteria bacterium GWC2_70_16]|nr:MAG: hypothetical protein A2X52_01660 [Candidatus Rokubacteria bacterium GWC2_70_16]
MARLEHSAALNSTVRRDDFADLGVSTWALVRQAVERGEREAALAWLEHGCAEARAMHDSIVGFVDDALTYIARFGEEEIGRFLRGKYTPRVHAWLGSTPGVEETMHRFAEFQRAHFAEISVVEEPDRYVMSGPCGSGGRLRRSRAVGATGRAHPWCWGRENVPYYCAHCCVAWEILPTEMRGYPLRIHELPERPGDPCVHLFYKDPAAIPEPYFTRIGLPRRGGDRPAGGADGGAAGAGRQGPADG